MEFDYRRSDLSQNLRNQSLHTTNYMKYNNFKNYPKHFHLFAVWNWFWIKSIIFSLFFHRFSYLNHNSLHVTSYAFWQIEGLQTLEQNQIPLLWLITVSAEQLTLAEVEGRKLTVLHIVLILLPDTVKP